ncbi:MAG: AarF/ABC1/UbiB kinase family protein [Myxococcales bacterium]|nr:AarF/ABC1/UbiB kinase family protein [Myxococcales bacterium]
MSAIAKILSLPQYARNVGRLRFLIAVVIRHGFGHVLERAGLLQLLRMAPGLRADESVANKRWEVRVRLALESLGPTFVKLGQMLATRPDIIPMSLIHELRKLQDDVPAVPFADAERLVRSELGVPLETAFAHIDPTPLAAASIAQVHRARLQTGEEVVLKIQRPNLDETIRTDLELLRFVANQLEERVPEVRQFRPLAAVEEFARNLKRETNFDNELNNIERFTRQFADNDKVHVPVTWPEFSSRRVLVMEFIDGCKVTDLEQLEKWQLSGAEAANVGTELVMSSIFEHGFFHGDPHPGNFFVLRDGRLAVIDFGMMGSLDRDRIEDLLGFMASILMNDPEMLVTQLLDMGIIDDAVDLRALRAEVSELMGRYYGLDLAKVDIGVFITETFETIVRFGVFLPADLLLIAKSISTMEGIAREIHPDFNPMEDLRPYFIRLYVQRALDPQTYSRRAFRVLHDYWSLIQRTPNDVRGTLRRLHAGELSFDVRDPGADLLHQRTERRTNRAIVAASCLATWGLFAWLLPTAEQRGWMSVVTWWTALVGITGLWTGTLLGFSLLRSREL